jgi:hypothetical protein
MQIISPETAKILSDLLGVAFLLGLIAAVNLISQAKARP